MQSFRPSTTEKLFSENLEKLTSDCRGKILAAFSGGCDSLALLVLLCRTLNPENVVAAYVNHRLRTDEELEKEIDLNRKNCARLGVDLVEIDLGKGRVGELAAQRGNGVEEAARILRYKALARCAAGNGCSCIATAHHLDDQLETVYMRMQRNSPVTSLRGIAESRAEGGIRVIRPLLNIRKKDLCAYLEENGFAWSEDSTNAGLSYERNRVRNVELPAFMKEHPDYEKIILGVRENAVSECSGFVFEPSDHVDLAFYNSLAKAHRMIVLYSMWEYVMGDLLPQSLIERVESRSGNVNMISANGAVFSFSDKTLWLTAVSDNSLFENFCTEFDSEKGVIELPLGMVLENGGQENSRTLRINPALFSSKAVVRFPREGDRMTLAGGTKRLSRILQDMKIPPALRTRVPVIADGKGICALFGSIYGAADRLASRMKETDTRSGRTCTCRKKRN